MRNDQQNRNLKEALEGMAIWEIVLFIPIGFLIYYLQADNIFEIIVNIFIVVFCTIGFFSTVHFLKKFFAKKHN